MIVQKEQLWMSAGAAHHAWVMIKPTYVQIELMQMPSYFTNANTHTQSSSTTVICRPCARQRERERERGRERVCRASWLMRLLAAVGLPTPQSKPAGPKVPNLGFPHQTGFSLVYEEDRLTVLVPADVCQSGNQKNKQKCRNVAQTRGRQRARSDQV